MAKKRDRRRFHVVLGIYRGIVQDVLLYGDEGLAERKYGALKKYYGIREGEESEAENEVKWFVTPLIRRKVIKR